MRAVILKQQRTKSRVCITTFRLAHLDLTSLLVDAEKAREKIPGKDNAEKFGKDVGKEVGSNIDDAVSPPEIRVAEPELY
jgi:hypothetical protein